MLTLADRGGRELRPMLPSLTKMPKNVQKKGYQNSSLYIHNFDKIFIPPPPIPADSSHFKQFSVMSSHLKPFQPFPVYSSHLQPILAYSSLFHPISAYFGVYQPIPAYSRLLHPIPEYCSIIDRAIQHCQTMKKYEKQ